MINHILIKNKENNINRVKAYNRQIPKEEINKNTISFE